MNMQFLEQLRRSPFSPARRIFVLQEILHRAQTFGHERFRTSILDIIDRDDRNLRARARRDLEPLRDPDARNLERDEENERAFLQLLVDIAASCQPATAQHLLDPARQQIYRLQDFAARGFVKAEASRSTQPRLAV